MKKQCSPQEKIFLIFCIVKEIEKGNTGLAKQLKFDLIEFLKNENYEFDWAEEIEVTN